MNKQDNIIKKTCKITLRDFAHKKKPNLEISAELIRETRQALRFSRSVFALHLRTSPRTLEKWELGKSSPNSQAAALILLVRKYPDTLARLAKI